ncbi:hypothetical protein EVAR_10485_1 [Eumeta japonica]|uniref:Nose resistant to fluoxetine protein 6 n=1 Tax=Eumeta variegata TaxID=151549 RepID=A0A4C1TKL1_EUMVA|nr:hypothetical protein EVAR_10485_1 [Eumeta japonica]
MLNIILGAAIHVTLVSGVFRGVLEWGGWAWCGRVSYGAYLLHFMFQKGLYGSMQTTHMFDYFTLVVLFSTTFMTYLLAVLLWLLVEEPLNQLSKILLRNEPKKDMNGIKNMDMEVNQTTC